MMREGGMAGWFPSCITHHAPLKSFLKPLGIVIVALVALGVLRYQPWQRGHGVRDGAALPAAARPVLKVGFLPVT